MAAVTTTEFVKSPNHAVALPFSLIEQRGLTSRLIQELQSAFGELTRDPRAFIRGLFVADTKDAKRRQRIQIGLAFALISHLALFGAIAVLGWRAMFVKSPVEGSPGYTVTFPLREAPTSSTEPKQPDVPKGASGGGGGGQESVPPPSRGLPPLILPRPQVVDMNPSTVPDPTLPVLPTVVGPESPPPPPGPIGDPSGKSGEFSGGPGSGGGIGRGGGTGVGGGNDGGVGPGGKGGKGGGNAGLPDGSGSRTPTAFEFNRIPALQGYKSWSWIYRPTPTITPEARENQVIGIVLMKATFNADGTISDIEVIMPVEFMTESAKESLQRSTFRPATLNGVPITLRKVPIKVFVHY
ncbi:MAG TPA: energy transducer TonB [Blastocatellia bacterium]|nr:energy transducer TonB [Blastocatellia bacterium]